MDGRRGGGVGGWVMTGRHLGCHAPHVHATPLQPPHPPYTARRAPRRQSAAGDRLRVTYDGLARDPNSLANLDQDLPNYAQHAVPIFSLPKVLGAWGECGCVLGGGWRASAWALNAILGGRLLHTRARAHPPACLLCRSGCGARRGADRRRAPRWVGGCAHACSSARRQQGRLHPTPQPQPRSRFAPPHTHTHTHSPASVCCFHQAKTIDLCNNPLTKEPKLQSARRIIAGGCRCQRGEVARVAGGAAASPALRPPNLAPN